MPISSSAATIDKKKAFKSQTSIKSVDQSHVPAAAAEGEKTLLKIAPALPARDRRSFYVRSHSTLNSSTGGKQHDGVASVRSECIVVQSLPDGVHVSRAADERDALPDRISLDRRGLTALPLIDGEPRLRLLSLQHNLVCNLETLNRQSFPALVFLDIYDNQLEQMQHLDRLENLRVLLMGKNRIKKIEGLEKLSKIEVLDLHGNQITQVGGLTSLVELKVLNLAGNQIRVIGAKDLLGLHSLQELNLRRNRLRKLLGFAEVPNLSKLFISNNDLQCIEDMNSLAKSTNIKEISIDNNPVSLAGDCISFLVSYLPNLIKLNSMLITEQVRKAAMAWRRNKETTNAAFMDLTSDVSTNFRREEVISNARTNWELLRSQTKCLTGTASTVERTVRNLQPDSDFVLTSLARPATAAAVKPKVGPKAPALPDRRLKLARTPSQDTENSQNTSSNGSSAEPFRLPPILVPIVGRIEQKNGSLRGSGSVSSTGPNVDSPISSLASEAVESSSSESSSKDSDSESEGEEEGDDEEEEEEPKKGSEGPNDQKPPSPKQTDAADLPARNVCPTETSSVLSSVSTTTSNLSLPSNSSSDMSNKSRSRNIRSAVHGKSIPPRYNCRAMTAKPKKLTSPPPPKDREQGGDYLIEICGRYLNIYGQAALRFIDKPWNSSKANDVYIVKFNYVNFNSIAGFLNRLKHRFPNVDSLAFKETNITYLGQLNALSEMQGLTSLNIDPEGNPICEKVWERYAIYRLAHWGLKVINDKEITEEEIKVANVEYQSLSDLVLWSLPDVLLQPLLLRLRIDVHHGITEQNAKNWLMCADPELRSVVSKEALQWKKGSLNQEDTALRQKVKQNVSGLLEEMGNAMNKLMILEQEWPTILHNFVQNTLLDYSQLDLYMKQKIQEMSK